MPRVSGKPSKDELLAAAKGWANAAANATGNDEEVEWGLLMSMRYLAEAKCRR